MPKLHTPSLFLGAAVVGVGLLALSAVQATHAPLPTTAAAQFPTVQVSGIPTPGQMVVIKEGAPYTVPVGRVFVATGLGSTSLGYSAILSVNGLQEARVETGIGTSSMITGSCVAPLPPGLAVPGGAVITVHSTPDSDGRAWGYVAAP